VSSTRCRLSGISPLSFLPVAFFFFVFFFPVFVLYIPFVSPIQYVCVLLKFYLDFSWLDARSTLFYLRMCVNVINAQMQFWQGLLYLHK
jgi:hypothetical protein